MTEHRFTDAATISGTRKTQDGYLVAEAFAVRTGIQTYSGAEVGLVDRDTVRVYRPEDEVRDVASMTTFQHAPITLGHPEKVTADNWKDLAKGEVSTEAQWDGNKIKLPLIVKDAEAIAAIEAGTRELSAGYTCALDFTDGETPEGEAYDAVQRNIRINHIAIVPKGRAGSECRIGDGVDKWGAAPITPSRKKEDTMSDALKTVVLGDKAAQVAASDAAIIEQFKTDQAKALADMKSSHEKDMSEKEKELAKKDAEIDKLKKDQLSDADLDKRVQDRADLIGKAKTIAKDAEIKGLSDADIRKAVVKKVLGDAAVADKSDAYIEARFDVLAEDAAKGDQFAATLKSGVTNDADLTVADKAYAENVTDLSTAWMGDAGKQKEA
jgi:hypothetical protein